MKTTKSQKGFAALEGLLVVLILVVVGGVGYMVYHNNHKTKTVSTSTTAAKNSTPNSKKTVTPSPYAGWKSATLNSSNISFKYPSNWTIKSTDANIEVNSPSTQGHYFSVSLISGTEQDVNQNFLGSGSGSTILSLSSKFKDQAMYFVAQTDANNAVTGIGLATTPGSTNTSFGISGSMDVTMTANLLPVTATLSDNGASYSLQAYINNSDYSSLVKLLQSVTFN